MDCHNRLKTTSVFSIILLSMCVLTGCIIASDDADAALGTYSGGTNQSTASNPYSAIDYPNTSATFPSELYLAVGGSVSIMGYGASSTVYNNYLTVTSGFGLTATPNNANGIDIIGTATKAGDVTWTGEIGRQGATQSISGTIHIVDVSTSNPVTSISITPSTTSSVTIGKTLTLTATTSPSSADNRHVEWSITSGSSRVTYTTSDTTTGGKIVLTGVSAGSVTVRATAADGSGVYATKTITVKEPTYLYNIYYDANGGEGGPDWDQYTETSNDLTLSVELSTDVPTRSGYTFVGWATTSTATTAKYQPGDTISLTYDDITLYAVWKSSSISFTTTHGDSTVSTGTSFSYSVGTSVSGCTISVSGASWLKVSGSTVYGTPTTTGTYDITVTASKSGYSSVSQTFTVTVVSSLGFNSIPSNGLIALEA